MLLSDEDRERAHRWTAPDGTVFLLLVREHTPPAGVFNPGPPQWRLCFYREDGLPVGVVPRSDGAPGAELGEEEIARAFRLVPRG